jgi:hypothetical protein
MAISRSSPRRFARRTGFSASKRRKRCIGLHVVRDQGRSRTRNIRDGSIRIHDARATAGPRQSLTMAAAKNVDEFSDFLALVGLVAGGDGVFDAMTDVIAQNLFFDAA